MPQPKRQSSSRSRSTGGAKKSGSGASGGTARRAAAARKTAQERKSAASRRSAASKRGAAAKPGAAKRSTSNRGKAGTAPAAARTEELRRNVQSAIESLSQGVVLTRDRLQETMDEAVSRGRLTQGDANQVVQDLIKRGRKQTDELRKQAEALRSDVEQLLGRAGEDIQKRAGGARRRAIRATAGDRALREVDRARRAAGSPGSRSSTTRT